MKGNHLSRRNSLQRRPSLGPRPRVGTYMTRLLAFTDPHGSLVAAHQIVALARREQPDLIVCAGDYSEFGTHFDGFFSLLRELGREILYVNGNHEDESTDTRVRASYPFLRPLEGKVLELAGLRLAGLPATTEFWPGAGLDQDRLEQTLLELSLAPPGPGPLVVLSHFPPQGSPLTGTRFLTPDSGGSPLVRRIVERLKPALVISGHYHQDFGREADFLGGRLVNPGPEGRIITV